jgi:hypothetical protein
MRMRVNIAFFRIMENLNEFLYKIKIKNKQYASFLRP